MWNGEPLTGKFKEFDIDVAFHPEMLEKSSVDVTIPLEHVAVDNGDVQTTLPQEEWFNSKNFPISHFHAENFSHISENKYQADGELTLKNVTLPLSIIFTLDEFAQSQAKISGSAQIKRNEFGIGWKSTDAVADLVNVKFTLNALP